MKLKYTLPLALGVITSLFSACNYFEETTVDNEALLEMTPVYHMTEFKEGNKASSKYHRITTYQDHDIVLIWANDKAVKQYKPINFQDHTTAEAYDLSFVMKQDELYFHYAITTTDSEKDQVTLQVQEYNAENQELEGEPTVFTGLLKESEQLIEK